MPDYGTCADCGVCEESIETVNGGPWKHVKPEHETHQAVVQTGPWGPKLLADYQLIDQVLDEVHEHVFRNFPDYTRLQEAEFAVIVCERILAEAHAQVRSASRDPK